MDALSYGQYIVGYSRKGLGGSRYLPPKVLQAVWRTRLFAVGSDPDPWIGRTEMVRQMKGVGHHKSLLNWKN